MFTFLMSLIALFTPPLDLAAPAPVAAPRAGAAFAWLDGVWRTDVLEMRCTASTAGMACREEGRAAMQGARADLAITPGSAGGGSQLSVALPAIPPSVFAEVARDARSVTYQMTTKSGIARLRFTRDGDTLTVERGSDTAWATTMTYRRG